MSAERIVHRTLYRACIIEAARAGNPPKVIAEDIGTSPKTVMVILSQERAKGIEIPKFSAQGKPRKFDHHAAYRMRLAGKTYQAIADRFGVQMMTAYRAIQKIACVSDEHPTGEDAKRAESRSDAGATRRRRGTPIMIHHQENEQ